MIPCNNFIAIWCGIIVTEANVDVMRCGLLLCEFCTHDVHFFIRAPLKLLKKKILAALAGCNENSHLFSWLTSGYQQNPTGQMNSTYDTNVL